MVARGLKMVFFYENWTDYHNSYFYYPHNRKGIQTFQWISNIQKRIIVVLFLIGILFLAFCIIEMEKDPSSSILTNQSENQAFSKDDIHPEIIDNANHGNSSLADDSSSATGSTWTQAASSAPFPARIRHTSVVFNNRMWVIGGEGEHGERLHDVWYSTDGSHWTAANISAEFAGRYDPMSVVYDGRMWIIGGWGVVEQASSEKGRTLNDTWYSSDGILWTRATEAATFPAREDATSLVYDNKIWILGGSGDFGKILNDVWYSRDGIEWSEVNASAAFPARLGAASVVYDDRMWIIGGTDSNLLPLNDIWSSTDGVFWTEINSSAAFPKRYQATSIVYDDKMWIIGGSNGKSSYPFINGQYPLHFFNDIWYSTDGIIWKTANNGTDESGSDPATSLFQPRQSHTSVVYMDRMWVIAGGLNQISDKTAGPFYIRFMNDTWYSGTRVYDDISDTGTKKQNIIIKSQMI